jgi:hypothetical protein
VDVQGMMLTLTRVKQVNANSIYSKMVASLSVETPEVASELVMA